MNAVEFLCGELARGIKNGDPFIIAVDGRCAAGKTTLANSVSQESGAAVVHMDDFFLQPFQRTQSRLEAPGGNADWERFRSEVLLPLSRGERARFKPFDCHTLSFKDEITVCPGRGVIVEGAYCCRPELWDFYSLRVFLDIAPHAQLERIRARNGENGLAAFREKWIPLEEKYFSAFDIKNKCDYCFQAVDKVG